MLPARTKEERLRYRHFIGYLFQAVDGAQREAARQGITRRLDIEAFMAEYADLFGRYSRLKPPLTDEREELTEELYRRYKSEGWTDEAVAKHHGMSSSGLFKRKSRWGNRSEKNAITQSGKYDAEGLKKLFDAVCLLIEGQPGKYHVKLELRRA